MPRKMFSARMATATLIAAAALTAAGAAEASAAPSFFTLTTANLGQNLATQDGFGVIENRVVGNAGQQFELLFPGGSSELGFGSPFQLRNKESGDCLRDNGLEAQLTEQTCFLNPSPKSAQLWQHHAAIDFQAGGKDFQFVFNRKTGRVISRPPVVGDQVAAVSSPKTSAPVGTAASKLQLWDFNRV